MRQLGAHNDIHPDAEIASDAVIANYCYVGRGARIGPGTRIGNFCEINTGVVIGRGCLLNSHCSLNSDTVVGDGTILSTGVMTSDERYLTARTEHVTKRPCRIGKDCRIGNKAALVCCTIGDHSTIGAGAVVLRDVPPFQVWAGVPAGYLRDMTKKELEL